MKRLRTNLFLLVLGTILPVVALSVLLVALFVNAERVNDRRAASDRVRALMTAVDAELRGAIGAAQALATSEDLPNGDFRSFRREALAVLASQPDWILIIVMRPTGEQVINTARPSGAPFPTSLDPATIQQVVATRKPTIGTVVRERVSKQLEITIRVPVIIEGALRYVLSADIRLSAFQRLIDAQQLREGSVIGLVDRIGNFIARKPQAPTPRASGEFLWHAKNAPEGWYRGRTVEGFETFTAFVTSPLSGWSAGYAVPATQIYAPAIRASLLLGAGTLAAVALALGIAYWMGRRITAPVTALASWARSMSEVAVSSEPDSARAAGEIVAMTPPSNIDELRLLELALKEAALKLRREFLKRESLAQQRQFALDAARLAWWSYDAASGATSFDQRFGEIFGVSRSETADAGLMRLVHPDDLPLVRKAVKAALDPADPKPFAVEHRVMHPDGSIRWVEARGLAQFEGEGAARRATNFVGTVADITQRKRLEFERERAAEATRLAELSRKVVAVQEEERRRLALELHDRTSPNLAAAALSFDAIAAGFAPAPSAQFDSCLADVRALLEDAAASIREIGVELRPSLLDYGGLRPALEAYAEQFARRTGIAVEVVGVHEPAGPASERELLLFRIVQEALTNAGKHAGARTIRIEYALDGERGSLCVADDGAGFELGTLGQSGRTPGLGLITMRERAELAGGKFRIESSPGRGTRVSVEFPSTRP